MNWYLDVLKKYAVFEGRAHRKEYWMFVLFNLLITFGLIFIEGFIGLASETRHGILSNLYSLGVLLPSLAVGVRRLHDTSRSGWWILLNLIPLIGAIILLVFMVQDSDASENRYGPNPKAVA